MPEWENAPVIDQPTESATPAWQSAPEVHTAKALAYGPIVGERHRDAMYGPKGNELKPTDVAISPNLEKAAGLKLGDWVDVSVDGKSIGKRQFNDRSFLSPGKPTNNVVELRDRDISGVHVQITPTPPPAWDAAPEEQQPFDTRLNKEEEQAFQDWKTKYAPDDSGQDYDLRGAFKAGLTPNPETGHWPDTFKKPNHPTFSDQSIYAQAAPQLAGHWQGDRYIPPTPQAIPQVERMPPIGQLREGLPPLEKPLRAIGKTGVEMVKGLPETVKLIRPPEPIDVIKGALQNAALAKKVINQPTGSQEWWDALVPLAAQELMAAGGVMGGGIGGRAAPIKPVIEKPMVQPPVSWDLPSEQIVSSAWKLPNGEVVSSGPLHGNSPAQNAEPGFLTTSGRFLNREDAGELATGLRQELRGEDFFQETDVVPSLAEHPIAGKPIKITQAADQFGAEMPVSAAIINDLGGLISESRAKRVGSFEANSDLWNDKPTLHHPTHNKIYSPRGQMPDTAAQELYDMGLLNEPSVGAMWNAIKSESQTSRRIVKESRIQPRDPMMPPESAAIEPPPPIPPPPPPPREPAPLIPSEPVPPETLNPVKGSGAFVRSYLIDKELGDRMEGIGAAYESGALRANTAIRNLTDGLSAKQEADLGKYLVSDRLMEVNPEHPQILPENVMREIESDPAIAKALDYYVSEIKPDIESWRMRAGLSEEAAAGKKATFISLIPKKLELLPEKVGNNFVSPRALPRTTIFAKAAKGLAKEYNTNLNEVLTQSYAEVIRKARVREFYDAAQAKGVTDSAQFEDLPAELKHDLTRATEVSMAPIGANKLLRDYQKFVTGTALTANPPELVNHMRRQLNVVAAKPPVGQGLLARLEVFAPYFGPKFGVFKRVVMDDMSLPSNQAILRDIFDAGGGSTRSFGHRYQSKIPGIKQLQGATQNLLFGIPKGKGVRGWDLRMRVQLEKIRRAVESEKNPQRTREFSNQIGKYGSHVDWFTRGLRVVNPYAATTVALRWTELKTLVGAPGFKGETFTRSALHRAETFLRGTGGTLIALATANYLLSNKWPWENDKGHEFDLNTGVRNKEGQTVYVKLRAIAPELSRPLSTLSIPELSRETTAKHPQYLSAGLTGPTNQALSLISGPGQNLALTAATGKVPYFLKRPGEAPELMNVATLKKGEGAAGVSRGLRQITRAVKGVNPFGDVFGPTFEVDVPLGMDYIQEPIRGIKPFGNIYSTSYEKKDKPSKTTSRLKRLRRLK